MHDNTPVECIEMPHHKVQPVSQFEFLGNNKNITTETECSHGTSHDTADDIGNNTGDSSSNDNYGACGNDTGGDTCQVTDGDSGADTGLNSACRNGDGRDGKYFDDISGSVITAALGEYK